MYKNFFYSKKDGLCHLWSDGQHGDAKYETFPYEEYAYVVDPKGEYVTMNGLKVKRVNSWSKDAEKQGLVFEHDVWPETRVLIDRYFDSDDTSIDHRILFIDIEIAKEGKYSKPSEALNTITSISYYDNKRQKYICLLLDIDARLNDKVENGIYLKRFNSEYDLLMFFINDYQKNMPDIITSWNGNTFDMPYLYNRLNSVLGYKFAKKLSPIGVAYPEDWGSDYTVKIAGVSQLDYLKLYKNFNYNEEPRYTLDAISKKELGRGKVEYEGSLDSLFRDDINKFVEYNVSDVELIVSMDKKLDFIAIAIGICHKGHVPYEDFEMSSRYLDGALLTDCKRTGIIAVGSDKELIDVNVNLSECYVKQRKDYVNLSDFDISKIKDGTKIYELNDNNEFEVLGVFYVKKQPKKITSFVVISTGKAHGAFVKLPKPGIYEFVYDLDLESEYPNNIKSMNISPETKWGRVKEYDVDEFASKKDRVYEVEKIQIKHITDNWDFEDSVANFKFSNYDDFFKFLIEHNLSISSAGILYSLDKKGLIPTILTKWGLERTEFRNIAKQHHNEGDMEKYKYYDRKQLVQKILLNSLYGVLLLSTFRFYDRENGESVTKSGQSLVKFSAKMGNYYYQKELNSDTLVDYCVYSDTDSVFFEALPIIRHRYGNEQFDDDFLVEKTLEIAKEVEEFINKSYTFYAKRYHNVDEHTWRIKQEMVGKTAFWRDAKKRYAMWIINKNGLPCDEVEIKGFDSVRSDFPKDFRSFMKQCIIDILMKFGKHQMNSKVKIERDRITKSAKLADILLPTGVKEISKFKFGQKGTPIHVKSAQNYNKLIEVFKLESFPKIDDGDKILWAYLKQNPFGFETIAIRGYEDPEQIVEFIEKFADRSRIFEDRLLNKMQAIWDNLGWGGIQLQEENNFF